MRRASILALMLLTAAVRPARAQDDVADVPCRDTLISNDQHKRYFLIGPAADSKPPKTGHKLLIILPGGSGNADFNPFVKRIFKNALPEGYIVAEPVSIAWTSKQAETLVWPTHKSKVPEAKFTTEQFIDDIIKDVRAHHSIDSKSIFTLTWSSSGPAAYAAALRKDTPITGSFIAMSVFRPREVTSLDAAKDHAFYLYQSREDKVCNFSFAEKARETLEQHGANVKLVEYSGGHGWHGNVFGDIRTGLDWLEKNAGRKAAPPSAKNSKRSAKASGKTSVAGENLIENGGFEHGTDGWTILNNSGKAKIEIDSTTHSRGKTSLRIEKTGGLPMDVIRHDIKNLPNGGKVTVSAMIKSEKAQNAFLKFFIYDAAGETLVEDVDIVHITGTADWKKVSKRFDVPEKAASGAVMFVMVMDGKVWLDEVRVIK